MTPDKAISLANDIACTIATLQAIADELMTAYPSSDYRDYNDDEPVHEVETPSPPKAITLEEVRAVLAEKSRDGHTEAIRGLLEKHGAAKLSDIDPSKYGELLTDAEVLGNG